MIGQWIRLRGGSREHFLARQSFETGGEDVVTRRAFCGGKAGTVTMTKACLADDREHADPEEYPTGRKRCAACRRKLGVR